MATVDRPLVAAAPPARAASAPPRARGVSTEDRALLANVKRSEVVAVKLVASYQGYDFEEVCHIGQLVRDGKIRLCELKKPGAQYKVPYTSMVRWCKPQPDYDNAPLWLVERDTKRRTSLPKAGSETVLGEAVEKKLMLEVAAASNAHCPYQAEELEDIVRNTAIQLQKVVPRPSFGRGIARPCAWLSARSRRTRNSATARRSTRRSSSRGL